MNSDELVEIIKVSKERNRVFTVNQNRRTSYDFISMWRAIDKGLIGKPYVIESRVEGSRGVPEGWRTKAEQGGGMMYDWGVHLIDQLMYMCDEKVVNVFCKMYSVNYPDVVNNLDPVYEQLIDAIEGKELKIKPEQALRVVKVMEAAFKSAKEGIGVNVNI